MNALRYTQQAAAYAGRALLVDVFTVDGHGGNPCPIVVDASGMDTTDMQRMARAYGHESAFVLPSSDAEADFVLRFFVPAHEMSMCGHATLGALWLLHRLGVLSEGTWRMRTASGIVRGRIAQDDIRVSQPPATVKRLDDAWLERVQDVLGITADELAVPILCNAWTSRPKTLLQLACVERLHALQPRFDAIEALCARMDSTGLYPFAVAGAPPAGPTLALEARQFPRASGYPEDAATGIAATALVGALDAFGLTAPAHGPIHVFQGRAMGRASCIHVTGADGVMWLSGAVTCREPLAPAPNP